VTLTGTVTRVERTNPHALISIDVPDAAGTTAFFDVPGKCISDDVCVE